MSRLGTLEVVGAYRMPRRGGGRMPSRRPGTRAGNWGSLQPLGLGVVTFTAASGTALSASQASQKLFHPKRLIIAVARTGTTATGLITVTRIDVGSANQLATSGGTGPIPVEMFQNTGVDLNINFDAATPGVSITVALQTSLAPTSPDTIACSIAMLGSAPEANSPQSQFRGW